MRYVCLPVCLSIYLWLLLDLGRLFSFLILHIDGRTPWTGISPSQDRYLHTDIHGFSGIRTMIPMFERVKKVPALDRAATVIGCAVYKKS
jgi:hypothetical protein